MVRCTHHNYHEPDTTRKEPYSLAGSNRHNRHTAVHAEDAEDKHVLIAGAREVSTLVCGKRQCKVIGNAGHLPLRPLRLATSHRRLTTPSRQTMTTQHNPTPKRRVSPNEPYVATADSQAVEVAA